MQLSSSARKALAAGLAFSTVMWSVSLFALPFAFAAPHSNGCLVNASGTIWLIDGGMRRGFPSAEVFLSHGFNFSQVVTANSDDTALPVGSIVTYADGTLVKGPSDPLVYLVANSQKRGFVSGSVFTGLGFSFGKIWTAAVNTFADMPTGANLESATERHTTGVLVKDGSGTVWKMTATGRMGIPSMAVFDSYGYTWDRVVNANAADLAATNEGVVTARPGCTDGGQPVPSGSLMVSTASGTSASATVPKGATNVNFLKFMITNSGSSSANVTSVTVHRSGAGATTDFSNVYLYQGSSRLTSGRSVNSSTNDAVFTGLNVSVPASGSVTLDVLADLASGATAGNVHSLGVSQVLAGSTSATGSATGNAMTVSGVTAGSVTISASGTVTNPKVGEMNVVLARFQLQAGAAEDLTVKRISLLNGGNVNRANLSNFKLTQSGNTVSTASGLDAKDKVNFDLNFTLEKGNSRTFEVLGDVSGAARTGDTIQLYVEEASDVYAQGKTFGFGASVTNSFGSGANQDLTLQGGQITISFNGPAGADIAKDGRDINVFNFSIAAQSNAEIRQLSLLVAGTDLEDGTSPLFTDFKVWDSATNTVVWGPQDLSGTGGNAQDLLFTEDVTLAAGSSKNYKVTADVSNLAALTDGETLTVTLDMSDFSGMVKNLDNNTFVADADIVPSPVGADLAGNQMIVRVAGLTLSLAGTPASQSYVKGSQNVPASGINFSAGTAKAVNVSAITLTGLIDANNDGTGAVGVEGGVNVSDDVTQVTLWDGATQVGTAKSPTVATGLVQFTNLNWTVPAGTTKTLVVKMNTSPSTGSPDGVKFGIAAAGVTASDADGNSLVDGVSILGVPLNQSTTMATGTFITIVSAGTVTVANAPTEIDVTDSHIVIAGQSGVTLAKYRFTAANEELRVSKLRVTVPTANLDEVSSLSLYDGATLVSGPVTPNASGVADFNTISPDFLIPKDGSKVLTVKGNLVAVSSGADSGADVQVTLEGQAAENFEVRGTGSSSTLIVSHTGNDVAAVGTMLVRKTKPTFALQALPTTTLSTGTKVIYKFTVTASAEEQVSLKQLHFTVTAYAGAFTLNAIGIREAGTTTNLTATATLPVAGGTGKIALTSEQVIAAGASKTYEVVATVAAAAATNSVSTSMVNTDTALADSTGYVSSTGAAPDYHIDDSNNSTADGTAATFIWSDNSAVPHIDSPSAGGAAFTGSGDWNSGYKVRTPTDTQTLVFPS